MERYTVEHVKEDGMRLAARYHTGDLSAAFATLDGLRLAVGERAILVDHEKRAIVSSRFKAF